IPTWVSEMLPLSFDLAMEISKFRRLMEEKFKRDYSQEEILKFIHDYLYVDENSAHSIYQYFYEQFYFTEIPSDKKIVIEHYSDEKRKYAIFHTLFGRRVNDCLSRAIAFAVGRQQHRDADIGINDNGFYIGYDKGVNALQAFKALEPKHLRQILENAIENSEVL
ncbi:ATP-dependent helicase, partial [Candidatus Woesearchaeota archaeon]|nr:ATP-dependent helicase [Candidatus Woesearchaeota archaeon]